MHNSYWHINCFHIVQPIYINRYLQIPTQGEEMKDKFNIILGLMITLTLTYGLYFFFKTLSYWIFYEGMVKQTIVEMVKQSALK